jgi:hypothetical protein
LGRAFSFAQRSAKNGHYTLEQLLFAVRQTAEGKKNDEGFDEDDPTTGALVWRLHAALGNSRIFTISRTWNSTSFSSRASARSSSSTRSTAASSR